MKQETEIQVGQKWVLIAGVVFVLLGIGFFLKYAFDRNWITPLLRVLLAYAAAGSFFVAGEFTRRRGYRTFGLNLIGGSVAAFYLSTYAAFQIYHLLNPAVSFVVMILITAAACLLSLVYDQLGLAVLGTLGGFLTPFLVDYDVEHYLMLFTYASILNAGILSLSLFKQWNPLNFMGFFFTWLLFTGCYDSYTTNAFWPFVLFASLFFLSYECVPLAYGFLDKSNQKMRGMLLTIPNTFISFGFLYTMIEGRFGQGRVAVATLVYALFFFTLAWSLYRLNRKESEAFTVSLAKGIFFFVLTVPIYYSGHWITLFWAFQALLLVFIAHCLKNNWTFYVGLYLLILTSMKWMWNDYPVHFSLDYYSLAFAGGFKNLLAERWATGISLLLSVYFTAFSIQRSAQLPKGPDGFNVRSLYGLFLGLLFLFLNAETGGFFDTFLPNAHFAAISVLWALFAIGLMGAGFVKKIPVLRTLSLSLFGVTLLKVFFFDMANAGTPFRIISFIGLGLLLILSSYLYYKYKDRLAEPVPPLEKGSPVNPGAGGDDVRR